MFWKWRQIAVPQVYQTIFKINVHVSLFFVIWKVRGINHIFISCFWRKNNKWRLGCCAYTDFRCCLFFQKCVCNFVGIYRGIYLKRQMNCKSFFFEFVYSKQSTRSLVSKILWDLFYTRWSNLNKGSDFIRKKWTFFIYYFSFDVMLIYTHLY